MKNLLKINFIFLILFNSICLQGQTTLAGGNISGLITKAGSPYLVEGHLIVPDNMTLTIEPGVNFVFQGQYKLFCNGQILAEGDSTDMIVFEAADNNSDGWLGFKYENTPETNPESLFRYCIIKDGNASIGEVGNDAAGGAFYFENFSKCIIDNCIIENNYATRGGAMMVISSSPTITNNTFRHNDSRYGGAGIDLNESEALIDNNIIIGPGGIYGVRNENVVISNNHISFCEQAGISLFECYDILISNNTIEYNTNSNGGGGGGILLSKSSAKIVGNNINNNFSATAGGGISCHNHPNSAKITSTIISNNLIFENSIDGNSTTGVAGNGGSGIYSSNNDILIVGNTIVNNSSENIGGGIYCRNVSNHTVINNIVRGNIGKNNSIVNVYLMDNDSDPDFYNNNIEGGINSNGNPFTGEYVDNIDEYPVFRDPPIDYRLSGESPDIDMGQVDTANLCIPQFDLSGADRIYGDRIDIGAYEYDGTGPSSIFSLESIGFDISLFPNPVTTTLNIEHDLTSDFAVDIYDHQYRNIVKNRNISQLDVSHWVEGVYYLRISDLKSGALAIKKFVVQ